MPALETQSARQQPRFIVMANARLDHDELVAAHQSMTSRKSLRLCGVAHRLTTVVRFSARAPLILRYSTYIDIFISQSGRQ